MDANLSLDERASDLPEGESVAPAKNIQDLWQAEFTFKEKPVYDFFKRIFDIVFSLLALTVFCPLLIIISLLIIIKDPGNPFFIQERIGKNEKYFKMIKFRTMYKNSNEIQDELKSKYGITDVSFKIENDPRVLGSLGRFVRKLSVDELLQLINILKGDMTIIGPRPLPIYEYYEVKEAHEYSLRYRVKQGLSCYWQINSRKSEMTFNERMKLDIKYIRERSFWVDFKIIIKTISVVLLHKNY